MDDTISQCVPDIMLVDFKQVYCPYSECVEAGSMEGKTPEQCSCERYDGLCDLNGDDESCSISSCCSEQQTDEGKLTCLGFTSALIEEPPTTPTNNPTPVSKSRRQCFNFANPFSNESSSVIESYIFSEN
jgi:hypothetical protein